MRIRSFGLVCIGTLILSAPVAAHEAGETLEDPFLDDLVGTWTMTGHVRGDSIEYHARGGWVLNDQFLRFRMEDVNAPPAYAARVYIGYDREEQEYVAHWLDVTGGGSSKTIGYGQLENGSVQFNFDYPEGPFRTTFERKRDAVWHILMRSKGDDGT